MKREQKVKTPGREIALKVPLGPSAAAPIPICEPAISGLYWVSDESGQYDQDVEAAFLLDMGAAGPTLAVAGLVGEDCRLPVTWTKVWTPASGTGGEPGTLEDGARLIVYPLADTAPGALEVSAEHDGQTYGPILLTVLRYACYAYSYTSECFGMTVTGLEWNSPYSGTQGEAYVIPYQTRTVTASLIGELSGGTVTWVIETEYGMRVDNVSMSPHSPDFSADISISASENYSVLTVTATVACGETTAGPFSIYFYLWNNT